MSISDWVISGIVGFIVLAVLISLFCLIIHLFERMLPVMNKVAGAVLVIVVCLVIGKCSMETLSVAVGRKTTHRAYPDVKRK